MSELETVKVSDGEVWLRDCARMLSRYMAFPLAGQAEVVAVWILFTWCFEHFYSLPYLCVTAGTKQAGKSTLATLIKFTARNCEKFTDPTAAACFRVLDTYRKHTDNMEDPALCTLLFEEAEKMTSAAASTMRAFQEAGYLRTDTIPRTMPGGVGVVRYPVACPRGFILRGNLYETLHDRSILVELQRGRPERNLDEWIEEVFEDGRDLQLRAKAIMARVREFPRIELDWLSGRERQLWGPLFRMLAGLGVSGEYAATVKLAAGRMIGRKTADLKRVVELHDSEDDARRFQYGEVALRHLASVLAPTDKGIWSEDAVKRMKAIPGSVWETYRGKGLTANALADLVSRFDGMRPRRQRLQGGRGTSQKRGWTRQAIEKAIVELGPA